MESGSLNHALDSKNTKFNAALLVCVVKAYKDKQKKDRLHFAHESTLVK